LSTPIDVLWRAADASRVGFEALGALLSNFIPSRA
jgi:hypothetical protein